MSTYALMRQRCGLSNLEAATLHRVSLDTVKSWSAGRNPAPDSALDQISRYYRAIASEADRQAKGGRPTGVWPDGARNAIAGLVAIHSRCISA